jgi:hypothetical protein
LSEPIVIALIVAIPPTLAVLLSAWKSSKKLDQIHVLVNDRLDMALKKIETLEEAARRWPG